MKYFLILFSFVTFYACSKDAAEQSIEGSYITNTFFDPIRCVFLPDGSYPTLSVSKNSNGLYDVLFNQKVPEKKTVRFRNLTARIEDHDKIFINFTTPQLFFGYNDYFKEYVIHAYLKDGENEVWFTGGKKK